MHIACSDLPAKSHDLSKPIRCELSERNAYEADLLWILAGG